MKKSPAMPSTAEIASGIETRDLLGAALHVSRRARVAEPRGELVRGAQVLDELRQVLEEVPHAADERHEQQEHQRDDRERRAQHGDGRCEPARHPGLLHDEADRDTRRRTRGRSR